jgi:cytochrome d ubiquinol oxidase subunit I
MQHPTGFEINTQTGHVRLTNFMAVVGNPQLWVEFPHVIFAAVMTGGMVVLGMSAFGLLRKNHREFFTKSAKVGAWLALVGSLLTIGAGDMQTRYIINDQPMKFAATEGIYKDTGSPASWQAVALIDTKNKETKASIDIPYLLSILSYHSTTGSVKGMNTINKELHAKYDKKFGKDMNYYVPVKTLFWSFRFMALAGVLSALLAFCTLIWSRVKKDTLGDKRWFLWILGICTYLPFVGTTGGWLITELGRYPWVVYGLQTIADAVSPTVTAGQLWFTNIVYLLLFCVLGGVMVFYSRRTLHHGPEEPTASEQKPASAQQHAGEAYQA